jgi:formylglycine-generating enzyme required for sulfatase activity
MTCLVLVLMYAPTGQAADMPAGRHYTNFIGMKFTRIEGGTFKMGQLKLPLDWEILPNDGGRGDRIDFLRDGDFDEKPVHQVRISRPFYMGVCEVTNFQYELFDPKHKELRGKNGFSRSDDEAVIYVSWYDAQAFCQWLSDKEGLPYRLPTEAEWEYACRANTTTDYYPGDVLPKQYHKQNAKDIKFMPKNGVSLAVGTTPANRWGFHDMHGNVEEWCSDWYGPYTGAAQVDPVGYADGEFRVTRGGSHDTSVYSLRSANRLGALPEARNWAMGFRVVLGDLPQTKPLPAPEPPLHQQNVIKRPPAKVAKGPEPDKPYFKGPRRFVNIPKEQVGPVYAAHNHGPAIVECPNGDLLAVWFSCVSERNREMTQAGSRLRWGDEHWDQASLFFDAPDRNDPTPTLWFDGKNKLYYFVGISIAGEYRNLAIALRTSTDSGATWSKARLVMPEFTLGHRASEPVIQTLDGAIAIAVDQKMAPWFSYDQGLTWTNPGGRIPGTHPAIAQLNDGGLIAFSRGEETEGMMTKSVSYDLGKSFTYTASEFPGIEGGQRLVLLKLKEGPLFFASFADKGITITDASGQKRKVRGLFTAVSTDGGKSWPFKRLVTDDGPGRPVECTNGGLFTMSQSNAEYQGYLSVCQSSDGLIHLISSKEHYSFNLKWLMTPAPPLSYPPVKAKPVVETFEGPDRFDAEGWVHYRNYVGGFDGKGRYTINSLGRVNGINRIVGQGSFEAAFEVRNLRFNPGNGGKSPGPRIMFRDARARRLSLRFDKDHIALEITDVDSSSPLRFDRNRMVQYSNPPASARARLLWNESTRQWRIFYGLNGDQPTTELPQSKAGIYFGEPLSETTAVYLVVDHGSADFDYFEIKPINP